MIALQGGIKDKDLLKSIYKRPPQTYAELMTRAEKYAAMNEALLLTHPKSGEKGRSKKEVINKLPSEISKKQKTGKNGFPSKYAIEDLIKCSHIREYVEKPATVDNKQKFKQLVEQEDNTELRHPYRNREEFNKDDSASLPLNKIGDPRGRIDDIKKKVQPSP
ncbi:hypothetical protein NE237_019540 [Protea cynaroides]|uniref:Uncharacterized protein n=1 Tax=Protea cynaroides TaxID=273540 RepID=A0A9Q0K2L3_9MAGN|nr:hypothetical protein NE237_019540 [Protea cynaroides]